VLGWDTGEPFAFGYLLFAVLFMIFHLWDRSVRARTGHGLETQEH
jgi:hypothetical protein